MLMRMFHLTLKCTHFNVCAHCGPVFSLGKMYCIAQKNVFIGLVSILLTEFKCPDSSLTFVHTTCVFSL